jgi:hypothetical protein
LDELDSANRSLATKRPAANEERVRRGFRARLRAVDAEPRKTAVIGLGENDVRNLYQCADLVFVFAVAPLAKETLELLSDRVTARQLPE